MYSVNTFKFFALCQILEPPMLKFKKGGTFFLLYSEDLDASLAPVPLSAYVFNCLDIHFPLSGSKECFIRNICTSFEKGRGLIF